ncbi:MAG: TraM recognition domain-containing protein, partial [Boseongicola sp. SB0667_bin_21]|nr:TraM recognition domain-containing protein [Boseongicola sp. SB0667_bin_21]
MDNKFWYSVKTEITNQLLFGAMPDVERYITMQPGSKLPRQVIDPDCDVFLNIPQHIAEDFAPMLRLMLGSMLTAAQLVEVNEAPSARRLFLIDEAAKLGNMDILENIRDRGRSLGLHLMMVYQTPGDIERIWGRAGVTAWRDGCSATVMGPVTSRTSAQDVSAMIGTRTVRVGTESTSSSTSVMSPMSGSVSTTVQEQLRDVPLISPTAISQLPRHASIITSPGSRPIRASKAIWFTREDMKERVRSTEEIGDELDVKEKRKKATEQLEKIAKAEARAAEAAGEARPSGPNLAAMQRRNMDDDPEDEAPQPRLSELAEARFPRIDPPYEAPAGVGGEEAPRDPAEEGNGAVDGMEAARPVAEGGETQGGDHVDAESATAAASDSGDAGDGGEDHVPGDDADATGGSPVRTQPQPEADGAQGAGPEPGASGLASASPEEVPAGGPPASGGIRQVSAPAGANRDSPPSGPDLAAMQRRNMDDDPEEALPRPGLPELARAIGRRRDTSDAAPAGEPTSAPAAKEPEGPPSGNGDDEPRDPGTMEAAAQGAEGSARTEGTGEAAADGAFGMDAAPAGTEEGKGPAQDGAGPTADLAASRPANADGGGQEPVTVGDAVNGLPDSGKGGTGEPETAQLAETVDPDARDDTPGVAAAIRNVSPAAATGEGTVPARQHDGGQGSGSRETAEALPEQDPGGSEERPADGAGDPEEPLREAASCAGEDGAPPSGGEGTDGSPARESADAAPPPVPGSGNGPGSDPADAGKAGTPVARDGDALSTKEAERFSELDTDGLSFEEIAEELNK